MKTSRRTSRRGFALLLTLIIVSFAAAIAVLFLLSARQERGGTDSYAQGARVRQLADTAVNIVMGQINTATREGTEANPISWASQPGMIRTYNNAGNLSNAYKLYSWANMIESSTSSPAFDPDPSGNPTEYPDQNWATLPMQYTDLNAPVTVYSGATPVQVYPIMDPSVANTAVGTYGASNISGYGATANNNTSGLNWDFFNEVTIPNPTTSDKNQAYYPNLTSTITPINTLPMPVQWLYILQDGTWVFPSSVDPTKNSATFNTATTGVSATNPIVGRIAFWTDDETNKVNLNTAGEGAYWDWPKAASQDEMQFAANPPVRNEFWRVSGHPGSTSLSAVFPDVFGYNQPNNGGGNGTINAFARWDYPTSTYGLLNSTPGGANQDYVYGMQAILGMVENSANGPLGTPINHLGFGLAPRYSFGNSTVGTSLVGYTGSQGGTFPAPYRQTYPPTAAASHISGSFSDGNGWVPTVSYSPIPLFLNHLYATPDEAFYSSPTNTRASENFSLTVTAPAVTQRSLSQRLFFLTTDSRAPETTLFNTPRVSMWPITWPYPSSYYTTQGTVAGIGRSLTAVQVPTTANCPTPNGSNNVLSAAGSLDAYQLVGNHNILPQEDILAFCATLNPQDVSVGMPYYFQRQSDDSPQYDWSNITRNQYLANYIRGMVNQKVPGFGNSLESTWNNNDQGLNPGTTADYITLECMDYCRSMINQYTYDPSSTSGALLYSYSGNAASSWAYSVNGVAHAPAFGSMERNAQSVTPLRITPAMLSSSLSPSNFDGAPPPNGAKEVGATLGSAYVTQGAFPSLKEVALQFIAVQRRAPGFMGPNPSGGTDVTGDPFYWANLINMGPPTLPGGANETGPQIPSITPSETTYGPGTPYPMTNGTYQDLFDASTAGVVLFPDGKGTATGASNLLEKYDMYPVGAQTTYVKAFLLFDFSGLRDGTNAEPNPCFWIKVSGCDAWTVTSQHGPPALSKAFAPYMAGPYHGRYSQQSVDTVYQTMKTSGSGWAGVSRSFIPINASSGSTTSNFATPASPAGTPVDSNWPFCSIPIEVSPADTTLSFTGEPIRVALYASYPNVGSNTPTSDPTGVTANPISPTSDTNQFITSYYLTGFQNYNTPNDMAMPIAPRWNVRQGTNVPYPKPNHVLTYYTGTSIPFQNPTTGEHQAFQSATTTWVNAEMVPDLDPITTFQWDVKNNTSTSPTPEDLTSKKGTATVTDGASIRDIANGMSGTVTNFSGIGVAPLDATGTTGGVGFNADWMMYATLYNQTGAGAWTGTANYLTANISTVAGTPFNEYIPPPSQGMLPPGVLSPAALNYVPGWSLCMPARMAAASGTFASSEGTPTGTISAGNGIAPLFTSTAFVSGSGAPQSYIQEAYGEITPYDSVIGVMVDPTENQTDLQNTTLDKYIQGDPRLTNVLGEVGTFNNTDQVINTMDGTDPLPVMVLNSYPTQAEFAIPTSNWTGFATSAWSVGYPGATYLGNGNNYYPSDTMSAQKLQLGNPGGQPFMVGYHLLPIWDTNATNQARWPQLSRKSPFIVAVEGVYGGNGGMGSNESYGGWVGLDTNAYMELNLDWDWTSAPGFAFDGGYIERPDQDYQSFWLVSNEDIGMGTPYFNRVGNSSGTASTSGNWSNTVNFSPNRQVPSPINFGTLPSAMTTGWQTLAFAPNQALSMDTTVNNYQDAHAGVAVSALVNGSIKTNATSPPYSGTGSLSSGAGKLISSGVPDHLLLDLFWMPVAEPYPISEQFSTAGKINLNYTMMPFPYITRKTGMDAVLKSVWIYALPTVAGTGSGSNLVPQDYKSWYFMSNLSTAGGGSAADTGRSSNSGKLTTRYPVNVDNTLKAFDYKFENGDIFRSASQICDMFLYPNDKAIAPSDPSGSGALVPWDSSNNGITAWWYNNGQMTSDNGREAPYNAIYSRVTTQSNTYMVHWKVQALHKLTINNSSPTVWVEGVDRVVSELRGATLIERYIDPNAGAGSTSTPSANSIPDYANPAICAWNDPKTTPAPNSAPSGGTGWVTGGSANNPTYPITYYYKWRIDNETYFQPQP